MLAYDYNQNVTCYVNNVEVFGSGGVSVTKYASTNQNRSHCIGARHAGINVTDRFKGYIANVHFVDGQKLTPGSFAESLNGIWIPKTYGSGNALNDFGNNGFYLTFAPSTISGTTVQDSSGKSTAVNWTATQF